MWVGRKPQARFQGSGGFWCPPTRQALSRGVSCWCVSWEFWSGIIALMTRNPHYLFSRSERNANLFKTCLLILPEKPFYESGIKAGTPWGALSLGLWQQPLSLSELNVKNKWSPAWGLLQLQLWCTHRQLSSLRPPPPPNSGLKPFYSMPSDCC